MQRIGSLHGNIEHLPRLASICLKTGIGGPGHRLCAYLPLSCGCCRHSLLQGLHHNLPALIDNAGQLENNTVTAIAVRFFMSRLSFSYPQEQCVRLTGKLMQSLNMLHPGARVGVAVSGGMDSWSLLQVLLIRRRIVPFPFFLTALHVNPGFTPDNHIPLLDWVKRNGVASHVEVSDHGLRAHQQENRKKSPCFYCAMLRRKRLFELCRQYRLTHLAFGHTADDLVSTFLLNMFQGGRIEGMSMKESFFKGALTVIRPLLLVEKRYIAKAVSQWELPVWKNDCPSSAVTKRAQVMDDLELLCKDHKGRKKNVFNALCRRQHALELEKDEYRKL